MSTTRGGEVVSPQIGKIGLIDLSTGNFQTEGVPFNVKNDGFQLQRYGQGELDAFDAGLGWV